MLDLALVLASVMVALLASEMLLRAFYTPRPRSMGGLHITTSAYYRPDPDLGWRPRPLVDGRHQFAANRSYPFHTNSRGLRDREYDLARTAGRRRIVVLGDSFAWGWGVADGEIFTERLEALLGDTDVINLGVSGYGLAQEIAYLKSEGLRYAPDVVVLAFCLNDVYRPAPAPSPGVATGPQGVPAPSTPMQGMIGAGRQLLHDTFLYQIAADGINTRKSLVRALVVLRIKDSLGGFADMDVNLMPALRAYPPALAGSWARTRAELAELQALLASRPARLLVALVPSLQAVEPRAFTHSIAYLEFDEEDFDLDKPYRLVAAHVTALGAGVVDPLPRFRAARAAGRSLYLRNDMHFNAEGHRLFAEAIAAGLGEERPGSGATRP